MNLTPDILLKICWQKRLNATRALIIAGAHNEVCPLYGISTPDIMHEFLANELHESAEFTKYEEGLNYSAEGLIKTFGRHRISTEDCYRYGRTPQHPANTRMIANIIYGGQWGLINLGNKEVGDGFTFRGSGPIQMTGRGNLTKFGEYMKKKFGIDKPPELWAEEIRTKDNYAVHSACWLFAISKQLIDEAIDDKLEEIVKKINGGLLGLPERKKYYDLCVQYIV